VTTKIRPIFLGYEKSGLAAAGAECYSPRIRNLNRVPAFEGISMTKPLVTVAIVPRERFSFATRSLESILAHTRERCELIYLDANSPTPVKEQLRRQADSHGFRLISTEHYLTPNVARNLAARHVETKYVAFVDNDVLVTPNWLTRLVACAEQTGAWAVGPLYCQGEPMGETIHMAGGTAHFYQQGGKRFLREAHTLGGEPLSQHRPDLRRGPVELLEYHCVLLRMEVFDRWGSLDEQLLSVHEHVDLCLTLREAGLGVYMEPASEITYIGPLPLAASDRDYFSLRWCDWWNRLSLEHFQNKWDVDSSDPSLRDVLRWATAHRNKALTMWQELLRPIGRGRAARLTSYCETAFNRARYPRQLCQPDARFGGGRQANPSGETSSRQRAVRAA
jgi:GT2 family glycosyltransferase